ncbi:MAG: glycosyltransferase family 2 protein [Candidatus Omnitrophota bacterium]
MDRERIKGAKALVIIPAFNEQGKVAPLISRMPKECIEEVVVINDGSTDKTASEASLAGATVLSHSKREGIGVSVRTGIEYALKHKFPFIVVMAGNGKDDPSQISRLLAPILDDGYDYVQGSRYIEGGCYGKMPLHRFIFTHLYSFAVRFVSGFHITDGTNGFRAFKADIFQDNKIDIWQGWLKESLEYYISLKAIKLGLRIKEVPVAKIYPCGVSYRQYTKVKPFSGWIERLKPLVYLTLGFKS